MNKIKNKVFILLLLFTSSVLGQIGRDKEASNIFDSFDSKSRQAQQLMQQPQQVALEGAVDAEKYFVGPSDKIAVNIWISPVVNFVLTVTPEGTLIIPTVGEVKVADKTLAEVKKIVYNEVRKKYINSEITITLIEPRPIIVTVAGNVLNPALYTLSSVDRVDKALQAANTVAQRQTQGDLAAVVERMSTRNILLKRKDGSTIRIDIPKFLATKEDRHNPYLREGDVVIVPRKNPYKNVIGVYGEVNNPGRFEYVEGDSITDALKIALGLTRLANLDSIEFSRLDSEAKILETKILKLSEITNGNSQNIPLEPGDRIVVKQKLEMREDFVVYIGGEVKFPGTYPITKNNTRLSDALRVAGGFTEFASLKSAELYRRSVSAREIDIERIMSMRGSIPADDTASYFMETELRLQKEIVNVDFEKLFLHNDKTQDVLLKDGDYIQVPSTKNTIYVFGQIISPGHIPFIKGGSFEYYVSKCGGFTDAARKGDVKIIKNKTKQWLDPDETTIEEGDYIWVPKKPERSFAYYTTVLSQTASILSVVVGIAVLIVQVTK